MRRPEGATTADRESTLENIPILKDIVILMAVSVPVSIVLTRFGLPTIVGFFVTGALIGPYGFALVTELEEVKVLAEVGVVLLLFTIGLEFSITRMFKIKREAMIGGGLQLLLTIGFVWFFETVMGRSFEVALLLGFIASMSSSAIVLKLLVDEGGVNSSHGNLTVGILLFQDICVVIMVMVVQAFGTTAVGGEINTALVVKELAVAIVAVVVIVIAVAYAVPKLFREVVKLKNREVFMLTIVLVCLGTAWLTSLVGLSLALGAFVAGLVISESEYSNQIVAEVLPFRDTFSSLFFISIGMLLDLGFFFSNVALIVAMSAAIMLLKALVVLVVGQVLRYPLRLSIMVALSISQIGEFSFILIEMGREFSMLGVEHYQTLLAVSILSMAVTPFLFMRSSDIAYRIAHMVGAKTSVATSERTTTMTNHVIIVGYGLNGRNLAKVLKSTAIEHLIMEVNSDRVRAAKKDGHKAYFADASHPRMLEKMGIKEAKMLVVGITDAVGTRRAVKSARELNPTVSIVVRTRYANEVEELFALGASEVIPEEFETSVEIFARVLRDYRVPGNIIQNQIDLIRGEGYAMLRSTSLSTEKMASLTSILETSVMDTFYVNEWCGVAGDTIGGSDLRGKTGVTVMAVLRKGRAITAPEKDFTIEPGDTLVLIGNHAALNKAMATLRAKCPERE